MYSSIGAATYTTADYDELDAWLAQRPVMTTDPLAWWVANRKLYPKLAQMAIDIHSIPGMSSLLSQCVASTH